MMEATKAGQGGLAAANEEENDGLGKLTHIRPSKGLASAEMDSTSALAGISDVETTFSARDGMPSAITSSKRLESLNAPASTTAPATSLLLKSPSRPLESSAGRKSSISLALFAQGADASKRASPNSSPNSFSKAHRMPTHPESEFSLPPPSLDAFSAPTGALDLETTLTRDEVPSLKRKSLMLVSKTRALSLPKSPDPSSRQNSRHDMHSPVTFASLVSSPNPSEDEAAIVVRARLALRNSFDVLSKSESSTDSMDFTDSDHSEMDDYDEEGQADFEVDVGMAPLPSRSHRATPFRTPHHERVDPLESPDREMLADLAASDSLGDPVKSISVPLQPYNNQVGGHNHIFRFSRRAVCKVSTNCRALPSSDIYSAPCQQGESVL
jgi:hypothetical protein